MGFPFDLKGRFESFIEEFTDKEGQLRYQEKIREMETEGARSLFISYNDLLIQDPKLAREILVNPEASIAAGEEVLRPKIAEINPGYLERLKQVHIRITDLSEKLLLRSLKTEHLGILTCFEGIVIGVTDTKPLLIRGHFKCVSCGDDNQIIDFPEGIYTPPYQCRNEQCQRKGSLHLQLDKSVFIDWQKITLQEKPEELPPGQLPQSTSIHILDDLVDHARPGDRVEIVGILKARASRFLKRGQLATYGKFFHGSSITKETAEYVDIEISDEDELKIIDLSKSPYIIEKIRDSLAPSIYGRDLVKEAIASLLFGGTTKDTPDGMKLRGESNILIVGDPGTGKSQILKFVAQLAPRALYTTGKGSTAAGLCVSGDSEIFLSDGVTSISDFVLNEFEKGGVEKYNEKIEYKKITADYKTYHSRNLNITTDLISRVWRIKTPGKLFRINTRTGNEIVLTPETSLLSISDEGLIWKQAKTMKKNERVATSRHLLIKERKEVPSVYELIADYPNKIILTNVDKIITKLLSRIKKKSLMTNKDITDQLGVAEDAIYRWKNSERLGNISLRLFEDLCQLAESNVETQLPKIIEVEIKKGQRLKLPKKLDNNWFYILGVIFGDGRVSVDNQEARYGGVCIGLSNREERILKEFDEFCEKISIKVNKRKETEERPMEYRIWSKILYHIFSKFGLSPSPKSSTLNPTKDMLYYPEEYLHDFLSGLFDSDGWISVREGGSSQIGITSTSKDLIEFVRYALLTLGIITYTRQREPRIATTKSGRKIIGKKVKFELTFNSYSDFKIFEQYIGFRHPKKSEILHNYCLTKKHDHRNIDNVPSARVLLKSIVEFYGYTSRELTGYKGAFSRSQYNKAMTRLQLKSILEKIDTNWMSHKVRIPNEMRFLLYKELETFFTSSQTQIAKDKIYEYFIRKNRNPLIPIGLIVRILNETEIIPSKKITRYFNKLISSINQKEQVIKKKYDLLLNLCDSDILWDKITQVEEITSPKDEFVYDLTIPETHNFIVNGFVTHNTAAVIRDQDTGEITLEAGALVLADQGIAMVDEFDKMRAEDRSAIHEAMEQHTISIAKAGIVATLNARTSILAAANPRRGRWNPFKATADNLNLPPTLLSRFDLIFVLEDKPDLKEDHDLASHILLLHKSQTLSTNPPIEQDLLRKYIAYARKEIHPRLTDEAEERILEYYKELRRSSGKVEEDHLDPIAITPRQLESLVRLSEARAKMRLSTEVSYDDASGAVNLMNATLEKLAKDAETGKLDIDKYSSGMSARSRRKLDQIDTLIDRMFEEAEDEEPVAIKDIIEKALDEGLNKNQVVKAIDEMTRRGILFEPQQGFVKRP
ncbi:MAG: LAGLIDADG family homing endonuclease [Candidatus Hodarchaeales archaeon]|jgi:replicative DNA helicase Mcm